MLAWGGLIPTAETLGPGSYGLEYQDGPFPLFGTHTRILNTQLGSGERGEACYRRIRQPAAPPQGACPLAPPPAASNQARRLPIEGREWHRVRGG